MIYDYSKIDETWNAPYYTAHRIDSHDRLRAMTNGEDGNGKPAQLVANVAVVGYDVDAGFVALADGSSLLADLIVAADGVHSKASEYVVGCY